MKKMSDVFELPLVVEFVGGTDFHVKNKSRQSPAIYSNSADEAFSAARAINHVDSLANALAVIIERFWYESEDLPSEFESRTEVQSARDALAAYRGEK